MMSYHRRPIAVLCVLRTCVCVCVCVCVWGVCARACSYVHDTCASLSGVNKKIFPESNYNPCLSQRRGGRSQQST